MNHHLHLLNLQTGAAGELSRKEFLYALSHFRNGGFARETEKDPKQKASPSGLEAHPKSCFRKFLSKKPDSKLSDRIGSDEDLSPWAGLAEELQ
jgi:hypothetical protein